MVRYCAQILYAHKTFLLPMGLCVIWRRQEISPEYSLEGLMLKLKLQYFGHLMWRTDSFEKTWCWERLKAGEGDVRGWDSWMASSTLWTWVRASSGSRGCTGKPGMLQPIGHRVGHEWTAELNWIDSKFRQFSCLSQILFSSQLSGVPLHFHTDVSWECVENIYSLATVLSIQRSPC